MTPDEIKKAREVIADIVKCWTKTAKMIDSTHMKDEIAALTTALSIMDEYEKIIKLCDDTGLEVTFHLLNETMKANETLRSELASLKAGLPTERELMEAIDKLYVHKDTPNGREYISKAEIISLFITFDTDVFFKYYFRCNYFVYHSLLFNKRYVFGGAFNSL